MASWKNLFILIMGPNCDYQVFAFKGGKLCHFAPSIKLASYAVQAECYLFAILFSEEALQEEIAPRRNTKELKQRKNKKDKPIMQVIMAKILLL